MGENVTFRSGYIALLGRPNAGKSTLLNAILKEKISIVSNKPQTTRENTPGIVTTTGAQMIFLDTPGLHHSDKNLNLFMKEEVKKAIQDADILIFMMAADEPLHDDLQSAFIDSQKKFPSKPKLLLINKIDLKRGLASLNQAKKTFDSCPVFEISAKKDQGIDALVTYLETHLPEGPAYYPEDEITTKNLRDLASEIIREKITDLMYEEIPYSAAVEIVSFKEEPEISRIQANIIVEHDSQKGMIIGREGRMIKEIGTHARQDLERLIGTKVYLELRAKVDKNWTKKPDRLSLYGYGKK